MKLSIWYFILICYTLFQILKPAPSFNHEYHFYTINRIFSLFILIPRSQSRPLYDIQFKFWPHNKLANYFMKHSQMIVNTSVLLDLWRLCANKDCSYSKDDIQSVGKVYLFQFTLKGSPQPLATITGHKTFMKLGSSLAVGNPYSNSDDVMLAVSAMTLSEFLLLACLVTRE